MHQDKMADQAYIEPERNTWLWEKINLHFKGYCGTVIHCFCIPWYLIAEEKKNGCQKPTEFSEAQILPLTKETNSNFLSSVYLKLFTLSFTIWAMNIFFLHSVNLPVFFWAKWPSNFNFLFVLERAMTLFYFIITITGLDLECYFLWPAELSL